MADEDEDRQEPNTGVTPRDTETRARDALDRMGLSQPPGECRPPGHDPGPPLATDDKERAASRAELLRARDRRRGVTAVVKTPDPAPEFVLMESMVTKVATMFGAASQSEQAASLEKARINAKHLDARAAETNKLQVLWSSAIIVIMLVVVVGALLDASNAMAIVSHLAALGAGVLAGRKAKLPKALPAPDED